MLDTCACQGLSLVTLLGEDDRYRVFASNPRTRDTSSNLSRLTPGYRDWLISPELADALLEARPRELVEDTTLDDDGMLVRFSARLTGRRARIRSFITRRLL